MQCEKTSIYIMELCVYIWCVCMCAMYVWNTFDKLKSSSKKNISWTCEYTYIHTYIHEDRDESGHEISTSYIHTYAHTYIHTYMQ